MKSIFVEKSLDGFRVALRENEQLTRLEISWSCARDLTGAIYLARVTKVLPGIQAAFLDIGDDQQVFANRQDLQGIAPGRGADLGSWLKEGRELLVQIRKPAFDQKAARVSAALNLAGFYCVLTTSEAAVRFSKRFNGGRGPLEAELRALVAQYENRFGVIVRSGASGVEAVKVHAEAEWLARRLADIQARGAGGKTRLIDDGETHPLWRCLFDEGYEGVRTLMVDDDALYKQLKESLTERNPTLLGALQRHTDDRGIFATYKLETEIERALSPRVWLKSGGYVDFNQTEAMVAIDVNSGKNTKKGDKEKIALQTNLEAAEVICRQLRLRELAGLIVVDLLPMKNGDARARLDGAFQEALKKDRAKINYLPYNKFGLVQIERERTRLDLFRALHRGCPTCKGLGWIKRVEPLAVEIQRQIMIDADGMSGETIVVEAGRELADYLRANHALLFQAIEATHELTVTVKAEKGLPPNGYRIALK